jgi:hypothetical protein
MYLTSVRNPHFYCTSYLTGLQWVGYTDSYDESVPIYCAMNLVLTPFRWSPRSAFGSGASDLISNFEENVPATFDRTKIGATWHASNDWIGMCDFVRFT